MERIKKFFSSLVDEHSWFGLLYMGIMAIVLVFACYSLYRSYILGFSSDDWKESCAGGQTVLIAKYITKGLAVTKFDLETGKPIPCTPKE